jgi:hypothetical protein
MDTVKAEFDGKVFVPCEDVELPRGTKVEVLIPGTPRPPTEEEAKEWKKILQEIQDNPPAFPSVDSALKHSRKRP